MQTTVTSAAVTTIKFCCVHLPVINKQFNNFATNNDYQTLFDDYV